MQVASADATVADRHLDIRVGQSTARDLLDAQVSRSVNHTRTHHDLLSTSHSNAPDEVLEPPPAHMPLVSIFSTSLLAAYWAISGWVSSLCSDNTLTILPRPRSTSGLEAAGIEDEADLACCRAAVLSIRHKA